METRQKTEYKYYVLVLAHVKDKVDKLKPVVAFTTKEHLVTWYEAQKGRWVDEEGGPDMFGKEHPYHKEFKKGSLLEWFNPCESLETISSFGGVEEWWSDMEPTELGVRLPIDPEIDFVIPPIEEALKKVKEVSEEQDKDTVS